MNAPPRLPEVLAVHRAEFGAELSLRVPTDLYWFQGHFPGLPILPGVVQIDWALAFARAYLDLDLDVARALKVKFGAPIQPEDRLTLLLNWDKRRFSFEYRRDGRACSSGQVPLP